MMIGKTVTITDATNHTLKGTHGQVIDETKNTITLQGKEKQLTIIKSQIKTITFEEPHG